METDVSFLSVTDDTGCWQVDNHPNVDDEKDLTEEVKEGSEENRYAQQKEKADNMLSDGLLFKEENSTVQDTRSSENPELTSELTLVLFGDVDAVDPGPNLLLDPNKERQKAFASNLYDLCGRIISIIDLLGQKNTDNFPTEKNISAFLLLIPHGQHISKYESWVQWLQSSFGKESLDYLVTVVTQESKEVAENDTVMADLKDINGFPSEKFHICTKNMKDEAEILCLLRKVDALVSKNDLHSYSGHNRDTMEEPGTSDPTHLLEPTDQQLEVPSQAHHGSHLDEKISDNYATNADMDKKMHHTCTDQESIKKQRHRKLQELFTSLHLRPEHKLIEADFLQIVSVLESQQNTSERNTAYTFLNKLLMLDYNARYAQPKQNSIERHLKQEDDSQNDVVDIEAFCSGSKEYEQIEDSTIHPLDIQMAVFHCSDSFLKQKMVTKLSQCQYALPLLVPDPFTEDIECPLWTFREVKKTWKKTEFKDNSNAVTMKSMPICKAETPMVFCFRLGSLSVSKSQLVNTLINERHSTFFHRNCSGSTKTRLLFDGVAEIAWYAPAGKPNDTFTDCVAFCNLHGDGLTHEKQLKKWRCKEF